METENGKFDSSNLGKDMGHNKNEWGKTNENQQEKPRVIYSYKVKWETKL